MGTFLRGIAPLADAYGLKFVPKAGQLLYNNNQSCKVQDWHRLQARQWRVPIIGFNGPRALDALKGSRFNAVVIIIEEQGA